MNTNWIACEEGFELSNADGSTMLLYDGGAWSEEAKQESIEKAYGVPAVHRLEFRPVEGVAYHDTYVVAVPA